jgi:hypothetical protein
MHFVRTRPIESVLTVVVEGLCHLSGSITSRRTASERAPELSWQQMPIILILCGCRSTQYDNICTILIQRAVHIDAVEGH